MDFTNKGWEKTPLPERGKKYVDWPDTGRGSRVGLFVRTYATGLRSWVFRWTPKGGAQKFRVLGRCDSIQSVTDARQLADEFESGKKEPSEASEIVTVNKLLDRHIQDTYSSLRESSAKEYKRLFETKVRHWRYEGKGPEFGTWDVKSVTGLHAAALLADCRKTATRSATILCHKLAETWEYGMTLQVLDDARNIWQGQHKDPINKRTRRLSDDEIVALGKRLRSFKEKPELVIGILLYLLSGSRHSNIVHARWEWVNLEPRKIVVPKDEHKTGNKTQEDLVIFLSTQAVTLLKRLKEIQETKRKAKYAGSPWLFPAVGRNTKVMQHRDDLQDPWVRIREGQSYEDVHVHDLRRTLSSVVADVGYKPYAAEFLGHSEKTVTDIYTRTAHLSLLEILQVATDKICGLLELDKIKL